VGTTSDRRRVVTILLTILLLGSVTTNVASYFVSTRAIRNGLAEQQRLHDRMVYLDIRHTLVWNLVFGFAITALVLGFALVIIREHQRRLVRAASTDALTGTANRLAGELRLVESIKQAGRKRRPVSVLLLDLDKFKAVNDSFGHLVGDQVLQAVAAMTTTAVRADDCVARWGGEEFLIVLPSCEVADAQILAERVRTRIQSEHFRTDDLPPCTASIGVAELLPGESRDELLARADLALYRAKELGRNRVEVAPAAPLSMLLERRGRLGQADDLAISIKVDDAGRRG
jgi:diguanylate cyclase (GGDEF)-like protein